MKIKLLLIIPLGFLSFNISAQTLMFQKNIGGTNNDSANCVQQTNDGGYIITGRTSSFGVGGYDVYLIKTDSNGNSLITKTFGGTGNDFGKSVRQTNDGGYIIVAETYSFGAGGSDIYLIKTDGNSNPLWSKTFGGASDEFALSVQQTSDGGYIILGNTNSFGAGNDDVYLIKTDGSGSLLWTKTFGGSGYDDGGAVQQTIDGGYIVSGFTTSYGVGGYDAYLIKTDGSGNVVWSKTFGGATGGDEGFSVQQTTDGGYIIGGRTDSFGVGAYDVYLIKTDTSGNILWSKCFGGNSGDYGFYVQQNADSGYIIVGQTTSFGAGSSDVYLIKTDYNGNVLWSKTYGGSNFEWALSVQQCNDEGYIIAGFTHSFGTGTDIYLIKTDSLGNSGCNESNPVTITTVPTSLSSSPPTLVSSGGVSGNPNTITGNGGTMTTICSNVGIDEYTKLEYIDIFPNPFSTETNIKIENNLKSATLTLYNTLGQEIRQIKNISEQEIKLQRDNLQSGIYFIRLTQDGNAIMTGKLIITD